MIDSDRLFIALLFTFALLWHPLFFAQAAVPSGIYISEIGWAGSSKSQADEWLEITNNTDEQIDVSLWMLEGTGTSGSSITIPEGNTVEPYSTFLIANYDADHENSTLAVAPNYSTTALSLSNSTLHLVLRNAAGDVVDEAGDGGKPPAGDMNENGGGTSMIRTADGWGAATLSVGFDAGSTDVGTPGMFDISAEEKPEQAGETVSADETETSTPSETEPSASATDIEDDAVETPSWPDVSTVESEPASASESFPGPMTYPVGTLVISDWLADPPSGENEWVEVYNPANNVIPLAGWKVVEAAGRSVALPDQFLGWQQSVRVMFSGSALNNDGDIITLLDASGTVVDEVDYHPASKEDEDVAGDHVVITPPMDESITTISVETRETQESSQNDGEETTDEATEGDVHETAAAYGGIRLSEVYPNTDGLDAEHEFIELEFVGEGTVDLFQWMLEDAAGARFQWNEHRLLEPNEQLASPRSDFGFALNNTGQETIRLLSPDGVTLDEISYENAPQAFAYARFDEGWDWTATPTPDEPNKLSSPDTVAPSPATAVAGTSETKSALAITIEEMRAASRGSEVRIVGVVTATPGMFGDQIMYLSSAGVQLYKHDGEWPELAIGDLVEVMGTVSSNRGETRLKIGTDDTLEVLEESKSVEAIRVTSLREEFEGRLVTVQGLVRNTQKDQIILEGNGEELSVRIKKGPKIETNGFVVGDMMDVTGIVSQVDGRYHLLPRSIEDIRVIEAPPPMIASSQKTAGAERHTLRGTLLSLATLILLTALYVRHRRNRRRSRTPRGRGQTEPAPAGI
jgi:DNA/RNA endonuclease YhcR with UshA esterase domain